MVGKKKPRVISFPGDMGDSKVRREYKKSRMLDVYYIKSGSESMSDIITLKEFLNIVDPKQAQSTLEKIAAKHSDTEIGEMWGVSFQKPKTLRVKLGVIKNKLGQVVELKEIDDINWNHENNMKFLRKIRAEQEQLGIRQQINKQINEQETTENTDMLENELENSQDETRNIEEFSKIFQEKLQEIDEKIQDRLEKLENLQKLESNSKGFIISLNREFDSVELVARLESLCKNLESTPYSRYSIVLELKEIKINRESDE